MGYRCTVCVLGSLFAVCAPTQAMADVGSPGCQTAAITPSGGAPDDQFATSVSVWGDRIVVGAPQNDENGSNAGAAFVYRWDGVDWVEEAQLLPDDGAAGDQFGRSVGISEEWIVVGAHLDDDDGTNSGSAYVFHLEDGVWTQSAKLTALDGAAVDFFGWSVAIDGDTIIVGAYGDDHEATDAGSAYVFTRSGEEWSQQAKLVTNRPSDFDAFGIAVAIDGDRAVVGAYLDDSRAADGGAAYIFERAGFVWTNVTRMVPTDLSPGDFFGLSVSLRGEMALVGSQHEDENGSNAGAAYIFEPSNGNWRQQAKLTALDGAAGDRFGAVVYLGDGEALIGAPFHDANGADSGAAYYFALSSIEWIQQGKYVDSMGGAGDTFGRSAAFSRDVGVVGAPAANRVVTLEGLDPVWPASTRASSDNASDGDNLGSVVALDGEWAIAGAPFDDDLADDAGSAAIYWRVGGVWMPHATLTASDGAQGDRFGVSVAMSGDTAVVGAQRHDALGGNSGAAYVFVRTGDMWSEEAKLTASDGSNGDFFGSAVAIDGDTIAVGAYLEDDVDTNAGAVYIFTRESGVWTEVAKLTADDGAAGDAFGWAVALDGDQLLVGARDVDDVDIGSNVGAAYLFELAEGVWSQIARLDPSSKFETGRFGNAVDLEGDRAIVGAGGDDELGNIAGAVYVFEPDAMDVWVETQKILAPDGRAGDRFGEAVSISGDAMLVGARTDDDAGTNANSGTAYALRFDGGAWIAEAKIVDADGADDDNFGIAVALDGDWAMVGADGDDDNGVDAGGVFFSQRAGTAPGPCGSTATLNLTTDTSFLSLTDALLGAVAGDWLLATPGAFAQESSISLAATSLTLESSGAVRQPWTASMTLADGALLAPWSSRLVEFFGSVDAPAGAMVEIEAPHVEFFRDAALAIGAGGELQMHGTLDLRLATTDQFNMAAATFALAPDGEGELEVMSTDIGPDQDGLVRSFPGHAPIETLRVGAGATLTLRDAHDNDGHGQATTEALYIRNLIVEADATLDNENIIVYYVTNSNAGLIVSGANFKRIVLCDGDIDLNRVVNGEDLAALLAVWGTDDRKGDLNGDGVVDGMDLAGLLAGWGACE